MLAVKLKFNKWVKLIPAQGANAAVFPLRELASMLFNLHVSGVQAEALKLI